MGAGPAGGNGGGGSPNQMAKDKAKKDRIENAKSRDKFGYTKPKSKFKTFLKGGGIIGAVTKPFRDASEEVNRKFYKEKVVPAGKSTAPNYETYMKDRLTGKTDAYGNKTPNEGGGNDNKNNSMLTKSDQPKDSKVTTKPSEKDLTNTETTKKTETKKKYDERKTKKKGRRKTMLTSAKGITKTSADYSLGKPTLLGKV